MEKIYDRNKFISRNKKEFINRITKLPLNNQIIKKKNLKSYKEKNKESLITNNKNKDISEHPKHDPLTKYHHNKYKLPKYIHNKLFPYQIEGVQWLWELHSQNTGGILADEMGLGKTIQIITFISSLFNITKCQHYSFLIVCPVTIMSQWKEEFNKWDPTINIIIIHPSFNNYKFSFTKKTVHIISYGTLYNYYCKLKSVYLNYLILDEGHKIRNPTAEITLICKNINCDHRIIISGAPLQNSLIELWSLFDFILPGKLGSLYMFENEFCLPIKLGGFVNASLSSIEHAHSRIIILKSLINSHILRREKSDVSEQFKLTKKSEHILFCNLTKEQSETYNKTLNLHHKNKFTSYSFEHHLGLISSLRKICNHPDLLLIKDKHLMTNYGKRSKSCKLLVISSILKTWKINNHRCLLFSQTRQMLDIIERDIQEDLYSYLRLDGTTTINKRLDMINEFNRNNKIFVFLLTTRTGGLGVNLTGADRVLIVDPDWNPSIDIQALERTYRIGQNKDIIIFRLISRGTVEEKIYHRQIYKSLESDKILGDSKQKRIFNMQNMKELFNYTLYGSNYITETVNMFTDSKEICNEMIDNGKIINSRNMNNFKDINFELIKDLLLKDKISISLNHDKVINSSKESGNIKYSKSINIDRIINKLSDSYNDKFYKKIFENKISKVKNKREIFVYFKNSLKKLLKKKKKMETEEIIGYFNSGIKNLRDKNIFKEVLYKTCKLVNNKCGVKYWVLKMN